MSMRAPLSAVVTLAIALAACSRCSGDGGAAPAPPAAPAPTDKLLVVDGVTITFGDVADAVGYFDQLQPELSRRSKMQRVIDEYVLPLAFARREYAAERKGLLEQARALRAVAGNVLELEERAGTLHHQRGIVTPRDVEIPIAMFLFDKLHQGAVSEPLELPQGYAVVGSASLHEGSIATADRCDAVQVAFYTHDIVGWREWLDQLHRRLSGKLEWFQPDFRDAVPRWLLP